MKLLLQSVGHLRTPFWPMPYPLDVWIKVGNFDALFGIVKSFWVHDCDHDFIEESLGCGSPKNVLLSGSYQDRV